MNLQLVILMIMQNFVLRDASKLRWGPLQATAPAARGQAPVVLSAHGSGTTSTHEKLILKKSNVVRQHTIKQRVEDNAFPYHPLAVHPLDAQRARLCMLASLLGFIAIILIYVKVDLTQEAEGRPSASNRILTETCLIAAKRCPDQSVALLQKRTSDNFLIDVYSEVAKLRGQQEGCAGGGGRAAELCGEEHGKAGPSADTNGQASFDHMVPCSRSHLRTDTVDTNSQSDGTEEDSLAPRSASSASASPPSSAPSSPCGSPAVARRQPWSQRSKGKIGKRTVSSLSPSRTSLSSDVRTRRAADSGPVSGEFCGVKQEMADLTHELAVKERDAFKKRSCIRTAPECSPSCAIDGEFRSLNAEMDELAFDLAGSLHAV